MRLLLDTDPLLWWLADERELVIERPGGNGDPANEVAISVATIWEVERLRAAGSLEMPAEWLDQVAEPSSARSPSRSSTPRWPPRCPRTATTTSTAS